MTVLNDTAEKLFDKFTNYRNSVMTNPVTHQPPTTQLEMVEELLEHVHNNLSCLILHRLGGIIEEVPRKYYILTTERAERELNGSLWQIADGWIDEFNSLGSVVYSHSALTKMIEAMSSKGFHEDDPSIVFELLTNGDMYFTYDLEKDV